MKKRLGVLVLVCFYFTVGYSQEFDSLVWSDEFNYRGLPDPKKWDYEEGLVRNNEKQYYTRARSKNVRVKNGILVIEAHKENFNDAKYTSASLVTKARRHFKYGRIEVRAKIPGSRGTWPAIWMYGVDSQNVGWPECGEIDIMENVGFDSLRIHANVHTAAYNHVLKNGKGGSVVVANPWEDFHIYALDWYQDRLDFSFNGKVYYTYKKEPAATNAEWPFDDPHYLILNLAIGGAWGGAKGIFNSTFPHRLEVDYVRVYR